MVLKATQRKRVQPLHKRECCLIAARVKAEKHISEVHTERWLHLTAKGQETVSRERQKLCFHCRFSHRD